MRQIILTLLIAAALVACRKEYKWLGSKDVELTASSDKNGLTVEYVNEDGETVFEEINDNSFYYRMSEPRGEDMLLRVTATKPDQRLIVKMMKDRHTLDYEDVIGDLHTVEVRE